MKIEAKEYIDFYEKKLNNRINFLSKLKIKNINTKEEFSFNKNIEYLIKNDYLFLVYNSIVLQKKYENNDEYIAIFLTNTLNSSFHRFKQDKNKKLVDNNNFKFGNTINLSYRLLMKFFKSLYKDFKIDNKYIKIEYLRVIEAHHDFTPHLHSLVFIKRDYLKAFKNHFLRKIKQNKNLGIYKFEIIKDITRSASYILKYVQKDFNLSNENYKIYYGWKLKHKIRAYTFSRQYISRELFNKLSFHLSKNFALDEESVDEFNTNNFYELVHKFTQYSQEIVNSETGELKSKTKKFDEDDMFTVKIKKERYEIKNCNDYKINEIQKILYEINILKIGNELEKQNLLNEFNFFVHNRISFNYQKLKEIVFIYHLSIFLETLKNKSRYKYQTNFFQIYKKHHTFARNDLVYDKNDWNLTKSNSLQ